MPDYDKFSEAELVNAVAAHLGVMPHEVCPLLVFLAQADVMERWGAVWVVHVRLPFKVAGVSAWVTGKGPDPLVACLSGYLKSVRARPDRPVARSVV